MVAAFKSTLEELVYTDIVIVVIDISDNILELGKKFRSCISTLDEIGVSKDKMIFVLNKSDLISNEEISERSKQLGMDDYKKWLPVSSTTRYNINQLKNLIYQVIDDIPITGRKTEIPKPQKQRKFQR
jgi:GTP-binding protein HflX